MWAVTGSLGGVCLPRVFMGGLVGRIFREFSITIIVSIFASGIVSLTLTPLMCSGLLQERGARAKKNWIERVIGGAGEKELSVYRGLLWFFFRFCWFSLGVLGVLLL